MHLFLFVSMRNNGDNEIKDWFVLYCNNTRRKSKGVCGAKHVNIF